MGNEPTRDQQSDRKKDSHDGQPVPPSPPQGEKEADAHNNAGDFAGHDIKASENQQGANNRRSQIPSGQSDGTDAALHVGHSALMRIE